MFATQSDAFQADLYPPTPSATASLSAEEWLNGKNAEPILINMENQEQSAPVAVAAKSYTPPTPAATSAPAPAPAPVAAPAPLATPTPPRTASPAPISTPTSAPAASEPVAATIVEKSTPVSPPASNGSSSNEEVDSLRKENEKLKGEVAERDTIIRELELKLERVRVSKPGSDFPAELLC